VTVTDGQGNYRLVELRPGTYSVTVSLGGFKTFVRQGIVLSAGFTAPVNAEMEIGSLEETITVTGATPIVDVQSPGTQAVLRAETLNNLPSAGQDLTQLASLTLGANPSSSNRNDVGGDKGSQSTGISIHGSRGDDGRVSFDGFNTNVFFGGSGGQQTTYQFNTVAVAEQVIDVSGNSAATETGGANVNMVPREGGNALSVIGTAYYTDKSLSSGTVPDSLQTRGAPAEATSLKVIYDYGLGIGGPVVKDKLWFFSANRYWGSQTFGAANNYFNKSDLFYKYEPDMSKPVYSDTYFRDVAGRFTWQATDKQKVSLQLNYQRGCRCWQGIAGSSAPAASFSFFYTPHYVTQGSWTYPATNKFLLRSGVGYINQGVEFSSFGHTEVPGRRRITNINDPERGTYIWGGTYGAYIANDNGVRQIQDNVTYFTTASYVTGSMDLQIGFDGQRGIFQQRGNPFPADGYDFIFSGGLPLMIGQNSGPFQSEGRVRKQGLFTSLRYTLDRLTVTGAVRFDRHHSYALPIDLPAGPFVGERSYPALNSVPLYKDITPRIGAALDVFGDGKTALRGSWGKYLVGLGGGALSSLSPSNAVVAAASRLWFDNPNGMLGGTNFFTGVAGNSDFNVDCVLTNFAANGECGPLNAGGFGVSNPAFKWDDRAREGWGVREYSNQWSVALQHELKPGLGVSVGYYHTAFHNQQVRVDTSLNSADFDSYCLQAPTNTLLGAASGKSVCGNYDRTLASLGKQPTNVWYRLQDAPLAGLTGEPKEAFDGVEMAMNWSFDGGALLSGGVSVGQTATDHCFANNHPQLMAIGQQGAAGQTTLSGPRSDNYCDNSAEGLWDASGSQVKLQAVYPLPADFVISGTFKHLPGVGRTASVQYLNSDITSSLGRNLSACGNVTGTCGTSQQTVITRPSELKEERLTQVDSRLQRRFRLGGTTVSGVFEVYNVFNTRVPQGSLNAYGTLSQLNPSFYKPTILLGGRLFKFGVQVDY